MDRKKLQKRVILSPHQKIMLAAYRHERLCLGIKDVLKLARDSAIEERASLDDQIDEFGEDAYGRKSK